MVCDCLLKVIDFVIAVAAAQIASPLWLAVKVQRPALTRVRVKPETVQTLGVLDDTEGVRPVAVVLAVKVYGN